MLIEAKQGDTPHQTQALFLHLLESTSVSLSTSDLIIQSVNVCTKVREQGADPRQKVKSESRVLHNHSTSVIIWICQQSHTEETQTRWLQFPSVTGSDFLLAENYNRQQTNKNHFLFPIFFPEREIKERLMFQFGIFPLNSVSGSSSTAQNKNCRSTGKRHRQ